LWVVLLHGAVLASPPAQEATTGICSLVYRHVVRVAPKLPSWADEAPRGGQATGGLEFLSLMLDPGNLDAELRAVLRPAFLESVRSQMDHQSTLHCLDALLDMDVLYLAENQVEYERRATQARNMLATLAARLETHSSGWIPLFAGLLEVRFITEHAVIDPEIFSRFERMEQKIDSKIRQNFDIEIKRSAEARANAALFIDLVTRTQPRPDQIPVLMEDFMKRIAPRTAPAHLSHVPVRNIGSLSHGTPPGGLIPPLTVPVTAGANTRALAAGTAAALFAEARKSLDQALRTGTSGQEAIEATVQGIVIRTAKGKALNSAEHLQQLRAWLVNNTVDPDDPAALLEGFLQHMLERGCTLETKTI